MGNLRTKDLSKIGYQNDQLRSLVINIISKHFKHHSKQQLFEMLHQIMADPASFLADEVTGKIAEKIIGKSGNPLFQTHALRDEPVFCKTYGGKWIEHSAKKQMELATLLPISVQGALMADAHMGFGLPIGGVLATDNAVIPYAVGMDIGCRMSLSIIDESDSYIQRFAYQIKQALKNYTHFGMEGGLDIRQEHEVLDSAVFNEIPFLKPLRGKAVRQLGTSGKGNHFVEFGELELLAGNALGLPAKKYTALLAHSGSRGLGSAIAQHYTKLATDSCKLPRQAQQLAWLDMNTEAGQEYWLAMTLAGDYAKACHDRIHSNLLNALGLKAICVVENHHNYAWKDKLADGQEVIIHRKGATPAHSGELGIIPGSMTAPAYLVSGKGSDQALYSASHGAGRAMSRQKAKESMTSSAMKKLLVNAGVTLIGGSVEENPLAYKDIEQVITAQHELIDIHGKFYPRIVRMNKD
ncbi:RtcB family protein [Sphingobacterium alkalisoli]|uniref:3'-phosphate/5'-hydroxy nucleic acid ligase n=2 Tax=Sphingobacterium TaxID=28453 RepID=A0A4U0H9B3_9SPHI|nr:RtcB family protein [Sphingobacterium alkalisoli]TJY67082.1 RtcB family protein [Sphingobacterium alkalisoli]GGH12363.1 RNA-splicing ligase RtcB [Sphingobacterium alkalisoli]